MEYLLLNMIFMLFPVRLFYPFIVGWHVTTCVTCGGDCQNVNALYPLLVKFLLALLSTRPYTRISPCMNRCSFELPPPSHILSMPVYLHEIAIRSAFWYPRAQSHLLVKIVSNRL